MPFTAYNNPGVYSIFNEGGECTDCTGQSSSTTDHGCKECSCCPPGTVEQRDASGNIIACLTPNDAFGFMVNSYKCPDGYVKWFDADGNFMGCVTPEDYATLNALP